ncbi:hypothetical protein ACJMK2_004235 [Sinanodonta woodiana]|uniref:Uncharacterized protein n=1 Tax=Sinanodonta woodiana TaxID=1069815 RepID=A0ABD3Y0J8_SINWO
MRNLAIILLFVTFFAVALSRDIYTRNADSADEALLEAFVRAVEEGKIDINSLVQDKRGDLAKRWWWTSGYNFFPNLPAPGKK